MSYISDYQVGAIDYDEYRMYAVQENNQERWYESHDYDEFDYDPDEYEEEDYD